MKSCTYTARAILFVSCLAISASCNAPTHSAAASAWQQVDSDIVLRDGQRVSGVITGRSLTVPDGATIMVDDDVQIVMSKTIAIEGNLVAVDRAASSGRPHGVTIRLVARERIDVTGTVRGGRGRDWPNPAEALGQAGGDGSDIIVESPIVKVTGVLQAGDGGNAGRGEPGGDGGCVIYVEGSQITGTGSCLGGDPGEAGQGTWAAHNGQGGMGGDSGGTRVARCTEL